MVSALDPVLSPTLACFPRCLSPSLLACRVLLRPGLLARPAHDHCFSIIEVVAPIRDGAPSFAHLRGKYGSLVMRLNRSGRDMHPVAGQGRKPPRECPYSHRFSLHCTTLSRGGR